MKIADFIRAVPDFPEPGILFRDISPLLANPEAFATGIDAIAERTAHLEAEVIAGIESRGFLFGIALAQELGIPFVPVRKPGKLPGETVSVRYELEYGSDSLELHKDAFSNDMIIRKHFIYKSRNHKAFYKLTSQILFNAMPNRMSPFLSRLRPLSTILIIRNG